MATSVERILSEVGPLAFPGVFDTLSAKLAERVGFPAQPLSLAFPWPPP